MKNISVSDINDIKNQIQSIDWSQYETAYGNAGEDIPSYTNSTHFIPKRETQLLNLFSDDHETAMEATHNLWCGLCHQYAFVSSAALPACEFLLYGLKTLDDQLKVELLDILRGFVSVISSDQPRHTWQGKVRKLVEAEKAYFLELAESENEEVAGFSNDILEELWRGGEKDLAAHMEEVLIKRKQERYAEYAEDVEIARGEMKAVKLYPTREVICDLYAIPSDNHQAFYAMVYQEESGYQMVYAKPQIYYPKEHEWTRMYGFRECKEVIREQMQHGSILQGRI